PSSGNGCSSSGSNTTSAVITPAFMVDPSETCAVEIITGNGSLLKCKPAANTTIDLESGSTSVDKLDGHASCSSDVGINSSSLHHKHHNLQQQQQHLHGYIEFPEHLDQLTPAQKQLRCYLEHVAFRL